MRLYKFACLKVGDRKLYGETSFQNNIILQLWLRFLGLSGEITKYMGTRTIFSSGGAVTNAWPRRI